MSSLLSEMFGTNRKRENNNRHLELCQGFNLKPGLSAISSVERDREGPIGNLYNSLKSLNKMKGVSPHELETETRILFDELGPELWLRDASRAWWLTTQQHYPKHICYEDGGDRARLWGYFFQMIVGKQIDHAEHLRKRQLEKENQHEDLASSENELDSEDEVSVEYESVAYRYNNGMSDAVVPIQSFRSQSSVPTLHQIATMSLMGSNKPAVDLLERTSTSESSDGNKWLALGPPGPFVSPLGPSTSSSSQAHNSIADRHSNGYDTISVNPHPARSFRSQDDMPTKSRTRQTAGRPYGLKRPNVQVSTSEYDRATKRRSVVNKQSRQGQ